MFQSPLPEVGGTTPDIEKLSVFWSDYLIEKAAESGVTWLAIELPELDSGVEIVGVGVGDITKMIEVLHSVVDHEYSPFTEIMDLP